MFTASTCVCVCCVHLSLCLLSPLVSMLTVSTCLCVYCFHFSLCLLSPLVSVFAVYLCFPVVCSQGHVDPRLDRVMDYGSGRPLGYQGHLIWDLKYLRLVRVFNGSPGRLLAFQGLGGGLWYTVGFSGSFIVFFFLPLVTSWLLRTLYRGSGRP